MLPMMIASWPFRPGTILYWCMVLECDVKLGSKIFVPLVGSVIIRSKRKSLANIIGDSQKFTDGYKSVKLLVDHSIAGQLIPPLHVYKDCIWVEFVGHSSHDSSSHIDVGKLGRL